MARNRHNDRRGDGSSCSAPHPANAHPDPSPDCQTRDTNSHQQDWEPPSDVPAQATPATDTYRCEQNLLEFGGQEDLQSRIRPSSLTCVLSSSGGGNKGGAIGIGVQSRGG